MDNTYKNWPNLRNDVDSIKDYLGSLGQVVKIIEFPPYDQFTGSGTGETYWQNITKWVQTNYGTYTRDYEYRSMDANSLILIGEAVDGSRGTLVFSLYTNTTATSAGYPNYCSAVFFGYANINRTFGTTNGTWWYSELLNTSHLNNVVTYKEIGSDSSINSTAGSFVFSGSGYLQSGYDYVGLQCGYSVDKWQMTVLGNLVWRQNDNGGTDSSNWTGWRTVIDSNNIGSYALAFKYIADTEMSSPAWYRVCSVPTYASFILSFNGIYRNYQACLVSFLISTSYTTHKATQLGPATCITDIDCIRLVRPTGVNGGHIYVDVHYCGTNTNKISAHIIPLDTKCAGITMGSFSTALSDLGGTLIKEVYLNTSTLQIECVSPSAAASYTLQPNTEYRLPTIDRNTTISLANPWQGIKNEYMFSFDTGSTLYTITLPSNIIWQQTPTFLTLHHYEFNISNRYGLWTSFEAIRPKVSVNLNSQWQTSASYGGLSSSASSYRFYESYSNAGVDGGMAEMIISIVNYSSFSFKIRSYAESSCDFVAVLNIDDSTSISSWASTPIINGGTYPYIKASTSGNQSDYNWTDVSFTNLTPDTHTIRIIYGKDQSVHSNADKGYVAIPVTYFV